MGFVTTTAILVDGGFYLKRAGALFGKKTPKDRADELIEYCYRHLKPHNNEEFRLYRIFYYDCPPSDKQIYHPLLKKNINLKKSDLYDWKKDFYTELANKRKVALRMGELLESSVGYQLKPDVLKKLFNNKMDIENLTENDFQLDMKQKGVDMRIGLDIASLAYKHLVNQIVLIAGDSDFVPAAKHARREGIDFILDPMHQNIKSALNEHIDGKKCCVAKLDDPSRNKDHLIINK